MTRKFFHRDILILLISLGFILSSCSMLSSEDTTPVSEMDGELANLEDSEEDGIASDDIAEESEEFEDFDVESASTESDKQATASKDSFGDIEEFNTDMIEDELSDENFAVDEKATEPAAPVAAATEELDVETVPTPAPVAEPETAVVATATNELTNLEYKSQDSGGSVVISAVQPFEYQVRDEPEFNQTIIEISDIQLAPRFKRPYIAKDFDQPVATINAYQEKGSTTASIVIQYKNKVKPNISMINNSLYVKSAGVGATESFVATAVEGGGSGSAAGGDVAVTAGTGIDAEKRLNIEMNDIAVADLIKIIADEIGFNVIVDEDVTGKINNVKLVDVPWQEGLSTLLGAQGLAYQRKGQILRVAKIEKITTELNATKAKLEAEAGAKNAASSLVIRVVPINYGDLTSLVNQVKPVLTPGKGQATPDIRSNSVVLYDLEDNVKRAEQIIRSLDIKPIQVLIEGRIIEAKSGTINQFGINWNTSASPGNISTALNVTGPNTQGPGTAQGGATGSINFGTLGLLDSLSAQLAVYEEENKIKILSSPRIVTINKEKAIIRQTTQQPLTTILVTPNAPTQTQVTFREAVLQIEVTPQVTFNSDVILDITVDRDVPGIAQNGSIGIDARRAQAKVLVKDGHSVVMGGILSLDDRKVDGGVPLLKDIPLLGYLFKSVRKEVTKNELVIFLQPKILNTDTVPQSIEMTEKTESGLPMDNKSYEQQNETENL